ncbi:secreted protein [Candidatus Thiomargarita nelsonii]|uniref:Secreted protein n=1 Tax=Candidatus Thiomargarita nelsonii TaxID=1003181 RepID=A0A176RT89_9GAMM|nr:secreted protein [Candidatus Thiomargarita nelsonii]
MNKTFINIFSVLLISLLAGYAQADSLLPYTQANIISTVNPILAVKSLAKQNPDKVPAIAASFAKRFPDAAADIAATLAKEFPDQATEIARAVAAALAGEPYEPMHVQAVPKTADEILAQITQEIAGKDSDIDRTTTMVASIPPSDDGDISEPGYFFFPYHQTSGRPPIITGGSSCMEVCLAGRNCVSLTDECPVPTPNTLTDTCPEVVQCVPDLCSKWCANS